MGYSVPLAAALGFQLDVMMLAREGISENFSRRPESLFLKRYPLQKGNFRNFNRSERFLALPKEETLGGGEVERENSPILL